MAIRQSQLREAAGAQYTRLAKSITEARASHLRTAFLCHSHADDQLVRGVVSMLEREGWRVYVDWQDTSLPATPSRVTAQTIKSKIVQSDFFLFLATRNSTASRWCPWEIGYADGKKPIERIVIIPTVDDAGNYYGNEYLQLYRKIDRTQGGWLGVFEPGITSNSIRMNAF